MAINKKQMSEEVQSKSNLWKPNINFATKPPNASVSITVSIQSMQELAVKQSSNQASRMNASIAKKS